MVKTVNVWENGKIVQKPADFVTPIPEAEVLAGMMEKYRLAVKIHVDQQAQDRNYDDAVSMASYANTAEPNEKWRAEAGVFVAWRSSVWEYVYAELKRVETGQKAPPTIEQLLADLPTIEWPAEQ